MYLCLTVNDGFTNGNLRIFDGCEGVNNMLTYVNEMKERNQTHNICF